MTQHEDRFLPLRRGEIRGPRTLRNVVACHCEQCRKQTGTYMSATAAQDADLVITESRGLRWYDSSDTARRGFCCECGTPLFWKGKGRDYTAISAGSLDGPTGLTLEGHIFCDPPGTITRSPAAATAAPAG